MRRISSMTALTAAVALFLTTTAPWLLPALVIGFVLSAAASLGLTAALRKAKAANQPIREDGPKAHAAKAGTPTMGGLLFVPCALAATLITTTAVPPLLLGALFVALIGTLDDGRKLVKRSSYGGLPAPLRLLLETAAAVAVLAYAPSSYMA